jgi:hypothetical protein
VVGTLAAALRRVRALAGGRGAGVVNLVGPLGAGKTMLLGELGEAAGGWLPGADGAESRIVALPGGGAVIVADGVDTDSAAGWLLALARSGGPGRARRRAPIVAASRRPLLAHPGWAQWAGKAPGRVAMVRLSRWPDKAIGELAARYPVPRPAAAELVTALSGGIPLIADGVCRALAAGTPAAFPAAAAAVAAEEVIGRLEREHLTGPGPRALMMLAAVAEADQELLAELTGGPAGSSGPFAMLAGLSIVTGSAHGLRVRQPYRRVLDLAYQWRQPLAHQATLTRAAASRRRLLAVRPHDPPPARILTQITFLAGNQTVRDTLFPPRAAAVTIRPARPGDEDDITRLAHQWARRGGLSTAKCDTLLSAWLASTPTGFHLALRDGHPVAMANMLPVTTSTQAVTGLLLQQHAGALASLAASGQPGGLLIGLAISNPAQHAAEAALLRYLITRGIEHGRLLVSTPWPAYQQLAASLGFTHHGATRDDLYDCGRRNQIYSQDFTAGHLPGWLDRLCPPAASPAGQQITRYIRQALSDIHHPARLARNPLLAWLKLPSADALQATLMTAIQDLCDSTAPADADAGHVLAGYYLTRRAGHEHTASKLHLSRSTYFRRLNHGITQLATRLPPREEP